MSRKQPGRPLRIGASEFNKALRAGELIDQSRLSLGVRGSGTFTTDLRAMVKNSGSTDIPAFGLCRWFGDPITAATLGDNVPELILRTVTDTTHPIGVAFDQILASASGVPAGIGQVQIMGVAWARVFGEFNAGDFLEPDTSFRGIIATTGFSQVTALSNGPGAETEGIIPVFIGAGGSGCALSYELRLLWSPATAVLTISVLYDSSTEVITLSRTSTAADIKAAIDAHTKFVAAGVECTVDGSGALYNGNKVVTLPTGASIVSHSASMTRTEPNPHPEFYVNLCNCAVAT